MVFYKVVLFKKLTPFQKEEDMNEEKKVFLPYLAIKKELYQCFLTSKGDYFREKVKHRDWPDEPDKYYADEWEGWREFMGFEKTVYFTSYPTLQERVRQAGIKSIQHYVLECKKNSNWPFNPENTYPKEWKGWYEFFGIKPEEGIESREDSNLFSSEDKNGNVCYKTNKSACS